MEEEEIKSIELWNKIDNKGMCLDFPTKLNEFRKQIISKVFEEIEKVDWYDVQEIVKEKCEVLIIKKKDYDKVKKKLEEKK